MQRLCAAAAIRHLARQQQPVSIEIHVKKGVKEDRLNLNFFNITKYKMCGGLICVVVGCHGNGNKLRYSFKILVLVPENLSCPALYAWLAVLKLNTEC